MAVLTLAVLILTLILGVPIAFALTGAGILGMWLMTGNWAVVVGILGTQPYPSSSSFLLTTIPMFMLMAHFTSVSGLARDLYTAVANWMSHLRGGLAIATVFASMIFGAMCGSTLAGAAAMSEVAIPNMRRFGTADVLSAGAVGVGAVLSLLIPPSVAMIIYGLLTETSIGALFIAGIVPGILLAILLSITIWVWVLIKPELAPQTMRVSWKERGSSLVATWPAALLILTVTVLLYSGIATPTEVGALGALGAMLIALFTRRLTVAAFYKAIKSTINSTTMIFLIYIGATIFGRFMTLSKMPQELAAWVITMDFNRWVVVVGIVLGYTLISMFMDEIPLMILTLPLTFPVVTALGFDPVWYGVLNVMMASGGVIIPPIGMNNFVVSSVSGIPLTTVYKGTGILVISIGVTTAFIMIFPQLVLWLPSTMR